MDSCGLVGFVIEGMGYIVSGLDYVFFFVMLLLVVVWCCDGVGWVLWVSVCSVFVEMLRFVMVFMLVYLVMFGLVVSGFVDLLLCWVELFIVLIVLLVVLDNLCFFVLGFWWGMVGLFGLVYGVGFVGLLKDLGLCGVELVLLLLGFNFGVELG